MKLKDAFSLEKAMTNQDSILKSRDITLLTNVRLVKAMIFPVVVYECESWTIKKTEHRRTDAFELWCWRRPQWTARRSNRSNLKEVKVKVKIAQSCLTLCDPMDCSPPAPLSLEFSRPEYWSGSAFPFSSRSSQHSDWTQVSGIAGGFFTSWATGEAQPKGNHSWIFIGRTDAEAEIPILWPPD